MSKPSLYINDICNDCNPRTYDMTLAKYAGQDNTFEVIDRYEGNYEIKEYLYECCGCGTKAWADEDWVRHNAVNKNTEGDGIEMDEKLKFSELLNSYEAQSFQGQCGEDWIDYFHVTVKGYFERCDKSGERASISGLKQEIVKTAKHFEFD